MIYTSWKKHGHACPHMYRIIGGRGLSKMDAEIRWNSKYISYYGNEEELTRNLINARNSNPPGIPLDPDQVAQIQRGDIDNGLDVNGSGNVPIEYFQSSLGKIRLRGPTNYWHDNAEKFSDVQRQAFQLSNNDLYLPSLDESMQSASDEAPVIAKPAAASLQIVGLSGHVVPGQTELDAPFEFEDGGGGIELCHLPPN